MTMKQSKALPDFQRSRIHGRNGVINRLELFKHFLINASNATYIDLELLKLTPVAIVSAYEAFFKFTIRSYVDHSDIYLDRALKLAGTQNELTINFDLLKDIKDKRVSIGEIIALSLKYSRPETISKNLSQILSTDIKDTFFNRLKKIKSNDLYTPKIKLENLEIFLNKPQTYISAFNNVFDLRHKYIHEYMSSFEITIQTAEQLLNDNIIFLHAVERMVWEDLYFDIPLTQAEMNNKANAELEKRQTELKSIVNEFNQKFNQDVDNIFPDITKDWENIISKTATFFSDQSVSGGSLYPFAHANHTSNLTKMWTNYLEDNSYLLDI